MAGLFDDVTPDDGTFKPRDPRVTAAERPRLNRQCQEIVDRLRRGRAANSSLVGISLKYTGRISDCRAAGFDIRIVDQNRKNGLVIYALFENGREVAPQFSN